MTTIAELVIEASVNPAGVRAGLDESLGYLKSYARNATDALNFAQTSAAKNSTEYVTAFLTSLTTRFNASQSALREALFSGALSNAAYIREGGLNAQSFNAALTAGLQKFRTDGVGENSLRQLVDAYSDAGAKAGLAFEKQANLGLVMAAEKTMAIATQMRVQASEGMATALQRIGAVTNETGLQFSTLGERGARAGVAVAFGMEQLANGSENGMRRALRAVASFGFAFGPEGMIVSALAVGTLAVMDFFRKAEKEALEFHKKVAAAANNTNADALRASARDLYLGQPYNEKNQLMANSELVKGAFQGSLADLEAQRAILVQRQKDTGNMLEASGIAQTIAKLDERLTPLQAKFKDVLAASQNMANRPADNSGQLAGVTVDALSPNAKGAKDNRDALEKQRDLINELTTAYDNMRDHGVAAANAVGFRLVQEHANLKAQLAGVADQSSAAANNIRAMIKELEKTKALTPDLSQTASAGSMTMPLDALIERMKVMRELNGGWQNPNDANILQQRLQGLVMLLREQNRLGIDNLETLKQYQQVQLALVDTQMKLITAASMPVALQRDGPQTLQQQAVTTMNRVAVAGAGGDKAEIDAANVSRENMVRLLRISIAAQNDLGNMPPESLKALRDMVSALDSLTKSSSTLRGVWDSVRDGIRGTVDALDALGKIDPNVRKAATGGLDLLGAVKDANKAKDAIDAQNDGKGGSFLALGNIATMLGPMGQAVGSAMQLFSGLRGMFNENAVVLQKNTERLEALRMTMVDTRGVGGQDMALTAIRQWQASGMSGPGANDGLDAIVKKSGLSLDQFNKMATDLGISFSKGTAWVSQFADALQMAVGAASKFSGSLDDQRALSDLKARVNGPQTAVAKMQDELALLGQFAPKLRDQFGQIDATSVEGRAALRDALKNLVAQIAAGTLTPEQLGSLKGVKDLAGIINNLLGGLDTLASAAGAAASAINGVGWYKVAQAVYATAPTVTAPAAAAPVGGTATVGTPAAIMPRVQGDRPTTSTVTAGMTPQGAQQSINVGNVTIVTPETDPEKLRRMFLSKMQQKSQAMFGTTKRWPEVQS